jgi:hypothetical protein
MKERASRAALSSGVGNRAVTPTVMASAYAPVFSVLM